jgi:hypothetical protein
MTGAWLGVLVENEMNVLGVKDDRLLLLFMAQKMARHGVSQSNGRK